jgi:hypothetical protein
MSILHYQGFLGCLTAMTPRSVSYSWHFLSFGSAARPSGGWAGDAASKLAAGFGRGERVGIQPRSWSHGVVNQWVAAARVTADLHRQAERDRVARAARLARKHRRQFVPGELAPGFARRVLAVLGARSQRAPLSAPGQAPKATS